MRSIELGREPSSSVWILAGETVRILVKFKDYKGRYLSHCHHLDYEDMGMMRIFEVA